MKKWHIDPIIPHRTGAARRLLKSGRKMTFDPVTGGIVIRQGNKVFEIRPIEEEKDIYLIFLINSLDEAHYKTWEISSSGDIVASSFKPTNKKFVVFPTEYYCSLSVVQSNPGENLHEFIVQDIHFYSTTIRYGILEVSDTLTVLHGLRNCFQPLNWDQSKDIIFNNSPAYLSYNTDENSFPFYWCSSRHPYALKDGVVRKDTEFWFYNTSGENMSFDYTIETGKQHDVSDNFLRANRDNVLAILDNNPLRYFGQETTTTQHVVLVPPTTGSYPGLNYKCEVIYWYDFPIGGSWVTYGETQIVFGSNKLNIGGNQTFYSNTFLGLTTCRTTPCSISVVELGYSYLNRSNQVIKNYDYDSENVDETFILFITTVSTLVTIDQTYEAEGWQPGFESWHDSINTSYTSFGGSEMLFQLIYRIAGGSVITKNLGSLKNGIQGTETSGYWTEDPDPLHWSNCVSNPGTYSETAVFTGQRITYPSVKVTKDWLLYTYVIQDKASVDASFYNIGDAEWSFNSRVVGRINRKTGEEKIDTFTTDTLEVGAAIGIHKIKGG